MLIINSSCSSSTNSLTHLQTHTRHTHTHEEREREKQRKRERKNEDGKLHHINKPSLRLTRPETNTGEESSQNTCASVFMPAILRKLELLTSKVPSALIFYLIQKVSLVWNYAKPKLQFSFQNGDTPKSNIWDI